MTARQRFASALAHLRQQRGVSQEELAGRAGLHRNYVGSVERGERNIGIDTMERLAQGLSVELADMLRMAQGESGVTNTTPGLVRQVGSSVTLTKQPPSKDGGVKRTTESRDTR
ncbi:helix-turn-helix domain-containing protein [Deinococcus sp. VB343]|uniref:helix-turn-helix domain-containing protein n=1 Tax=Deinococcus sp. VB343 TaxID=3385567 RepID=UPI0039C96D13